MEQDTEIETPQLDVTPCVGLHGPGAVPMPPTFNEEELLGSCCRHGAKVSALDYLGRMGRKVYRTRCAECLFSKNRIVSPERADEIIEDCSKTNSFFVCHKATIQGEEDVMCKGYFDNVWSKDEIGQMLVRAGYVEFVEQPMDTEPIVPHRLRLEGE